MDELMKFLDLITEDDWPTCVKKADEHGINISVLCRTVKSICDECNVIVPFTKDDF